jgi:hypothetical protein
MATRDIAHALTTIVEDDSHYVHEALLKLGFTCEFGDLTTQDMQRTLIFAAYLKCAAIPETWES